MRQKIIGSNSGYSILAYENALIFYVYGRVTLNTDSFLWLLPSVFYFFHHAIEVSIKTLLRLKDVAYPDSGYAGHRIYSLLRIAIKNNIFPKDIDDKLQQEELVELLKVMDGSYLKNKYAYPGYDLGGVHLIDIVDEIIFALFEEINLILKLKIPKHAPANIYVPEPVEKIFLHNLKKPFPYTVGGLRDKLSTIDLPREKN